MAKQFSDREKRIINYNYLHRNEPTFVLTNVFNEWFDRRGVSFDLETGEITYGLQNLSDANVNNILNDENGIIEIALLIKYLVDNGYIYLIKKDKEDLPEKLNGSWNKYSISNPLPKDIVDIIRQTFRRVCVSYDLISFVENGFKTYEDLQLSQAAITLNTSKSQLRIGRWSLIVSAIALVCTLLLSHCSNCTQNKHNEAVLNALGKFEANFCAINNQNTLELSAHIDSLGVTFNKQNTLNVNKPRTKRPVAKKQYNLIQIDTINCDGKQYIVLPITK